MQAGRGQVVFMKWNSSLTLLVWSTASCLMSWSKVKKASSMHNIGFFCWARACSVYLQCMHHFKLGSSCWWPAMSLHECCVIWFNGKIFTVWLDQTQWRAFFQCFEVLWMLCAPKRCVKFLLMVVAAGSVMKAGFQLKSACANRPHPLIPCVCQKFVWHAAVWDATLWHVAHTPCNINTWLK